MGNSRMKMIEFARRVVKRSLDLTFGIVALVALAPHFALIALAIKLESPGPVFWRQPRLKKDGATFPMLRFRCHAAGVSEQFHFTVVGHFLWRYRLDLLPILLNVMRGDVNLGEVVRFGDVLPSLLPSSWLTAIPGPPERYERAVWIVLLSLLVVLFVLAVSLTR